MCGIFASFANKTSGQGAAHSHALNALQHRGPDHIDSYVSPDGRVFLGHTLLSISTTSKVSGRQPMITEQSVLVFNGEVYNHKALRERLVAQKILFETDSDTETLLRGIESEGWEFLDLVEGCWAIALYSLTTGQLFFSRDPLGEKQLAFKVNSEGLVLASEAKAILKTQAQTRLDSSRILSDLIFDFFASRESTYFESIKNCRPGKVYCFDSIVGIREVYTCHLGARKPDLPLRRKLAHAVSSMVPEHHPYAVVLSGGLDSSIIASLLKTEMRDMPFTTITASYAEGRNDDLEYARHLVDHLGAVDHQELQVNAEAVETNFLAVQIALEEPLHDQVYITQYLIYKRIADLGFRVALNGQGADEFWGGYYYHYGLQDLYSANFEQTIKHFHNLSNQRGLHNLLTQAELARLIEDNLTARWANASALQTMLMEGHLQAMVSHEDRLSMASGVEVRLPFLNQALVKHALSLSTEEKVVQGVEKAPLRTAMTGILTDLIRVRRKQAFPDTPRNAYIKESFLADLAANNSLFSTAEIKAVSKSAPKLEWRMNAVNAFAGVMAGAR